MLCTTRGESTVDDIIRDPSPSHCSTLRTGALETSVTTSSVYMCRLSRATQLPTLLRYLLSIVLSSLFLLVPTEAPRSLSECLLRPVRGTEPLPSPSLSQQNPFSSRV